MNKTAKITIIGVFTAIAAVISALPIGINILGVPATLQTFAMAFLGFVLGRYNGTLTVVIYILMGLVGIPVFNGFKGGPSVLFGVTGGFIFGFLFLAFLCGLAYDMKNKVLKIVLPLAGLLICHGLGILQFAAIAKKSITVSAAAVSVPYLPKDILSVALAYFVALAVRRALAAASINLWGKRCAEA